MNKELIEEYNIADEVYRLFQIDSEYYLYHYGLLEDNRVGLLAISGDKEECLDYLKDEVLELSRSTINLKEHAKQ